MRKILYIFSVALLGLCLGSCEEDFLDTAPTDQVADVTAGSTIEAIDANLSGTIRLMKSYLPSSDSHDNSGVKGNGFGAELMGEDIVCGKSHWYTGDYAYRNAINDNYRRPQSVWKLYYRIIYNCNIIIINVKALDTDVAVKARIEAEALSMRAFSYLRLVETFQGTYSLHQNDLGVPIVLDGSTDGKPRSTVSEVYTQITADLDAALVLFATAEARADVSHINANVCHGIRARVALDMQDWTAAKTHADAAVAGFSLNTAAQFSAGFDDVATQVWMWGLKNNDEQSDIYAAWVSHLDMSIGGYAGLGYNPKYVYNGLYAQLNDTDIRKGLITSGMVNNKYNAGRNGGKGFAADQVLMRPEEMILISAEASAKLGVDGEAKTTLNLLRAVRYTGTTAEIEAIDLTGSILSDIYLERRIELWGEGLRLFDIKRQNIAVDREAEATAAGLTTNHLLTLNATVGGLRVEADSKYLTYLIPIAEINNNPSITEADQNEK